ncbi:DUF1853 family protein [Wielerella bovis]|uniref:DUF1853 family protein n=1 Tax=Wielerella bovis TaxID=2917790 RepID=UPI0020187947|nr:DUF1853 family protein [Wielerella bovis]ULJ60171.1 DUF1853 family protein [Wielerella bovis]
MNYALDAIWWRLRNPHIRALASLLTAPPLWTTGCELPVRELLGEQGFRLLLAWDDDNFFRLPENAHSRLGHYAEDLLAFWFTHAPHSRLIARDVKIGSREKNLGALDFVVALSGCVYHIELCCKYYGAADGQPENMLGLNREDKLLHKYHKLNQQIALSGYLEGRAALADLNVDADSIQRVSVVRGVGFARAGVLPENTIYPPNAWQGVLIDDATQWQQFDEDARFYPLNRMEYLAPARVALEQTINREMVAQSGDGIYAHVALRPDGFLHEIQRIMVKK